MKIDKNGQNRGRPTKYISKYIDKIDEYLKENEDEFVELVKQRNDEKGYEMYEQKLKVKLPTIGGFALFLGVAESTIQKWAGEHEDFSVSLRRIVKEQEKRLINSGLSGDYNPTIAKLILSANHNMREKSDITTDGRPLTKLLDEADE